MMDDGTPGRRRWGDARIAFKVIERQVADLLRTGRSIRSVYDELKPQFPACYAQFGKYVRRSAWWTTVRSSDGGGVTVLAATGAAAPASSGPGPRELVIAPPARFKHNPGDGSMGDLV